MKKLLSAVALATIIASPAFAQSFDPSVGSGNIARQVPNDDTLNAYAQQSRMAVTPRSASRPVQPFTAAERALFDRIRKE
jgi:hypothetical protein